MTVEYEAPGYSVDKVGSFGGNDCHVEDDPEDLDGSHESDLRAGESDSDAAISNVQFCGRRSCGMDLDLCVDGDTEAGNAHVADDGETLWITLDLADGGTLSESHVDVASDADGLSTNPQGIPRPG